MSKSRRTVAAPPIAHTPHLEDGGLNFRLCHLCLHLNEAETEIAQCEECEHIFKDEILTQFFDNNDTEAFTDANPEDIEEVEESEEEDSPKPVRDLSGLSSKF